MFVKLMFFAIETHSRTGTHAHTEKRQERQKREEKEINSRQHRCISINPPVYSFTLFILVLELECQTLFPHKWRVLEDFSLLQIWQQAYGFISQVRILGPVLSKKTIKAIKFLFQITKHNYLREIKSVCLVGLVLVKKMFLKNRFKQDPTQHLWEILTWNPLSADKSY